MLIVQTLLIALISTLYMAKFVPYKEVYLAWILVIYLVMGGIPSTLPTISAKTFGQKHFTSIYGFILLTNVSHIFNKINFLIGVNFWHFLHIAGIFVCKFTFVVQQRHVRLVLVFLYIMLSKSNW
jgi:hypothetical protein